ncbi:hypothetical protein B0H34DRAFT_792187 [Crassisporium funariophilum]|nr:hypothetical protein B0H34DRAFT_792187 [Crassisporium funariophilum]
MSQYQGSFASYITTPLYGESSNIPTNSVYQYLSGESKSPGLDTQNRASSSSQNHLSGELPDLYYEQDFPTPVTSSDMIRTPPQDWQPSWFQSPPEVLKCTPQDMSHISPPWQSSPIASCQASRPSVAPIYTDFSYGHHQQHEITTPFSMLFANYDAFDPSLFQPHSTSYPQAYIDTHPTTSFCHDSTTTALSSPSLSATVSLSSAHSDPSRAGPSNARPHNQPQLKLHQPRPSRRIPIISLSNLASACDGLPTATRTQDPKHCSSEEGLSPLSLEFGTSPSMQSESNTHGGHTRYSKPSSGHQPTSIYNPTFGYGLDGDPGKVILCSCGCMESYTFQ